MFYLKMTEEELSRQFEIQALDEDIFFRLHREALEVIEELENYVRTLENSN